MKKFSLINNVFGWISFLIALVVYKLTLEPSVSLWDCGEFLSASHKLQVVHPPGAPLFLMLGRIFSLFAGNDVKMISICINMLSAVASALTVLFTFWIIVHFAKKILGVGLKDEEIELSKALAILGSGLVGALALTFMDTFWFSAVEAEVYAISSCFTALGFWCIIKWETNKDEAHSDRWLILIAYTIGLAIGLHLLNLLIIPAVVYYYYFNKYEINRKGILISTAIGIGILGVIQSMIIPGLPRLSAFFDKFFVNSLGMPFNSGALFFVFFIVTLLVLGIRYSIKHKRALLNFSLNCFTFILLGYSSYAMVVIRSLAEPAIDMNNPEDSYSLLSYINREQYGDRPLLKGPYYTANMVDSEEGAMQYRKGEKEYEEVGNKFIPIFDPVHSTIFPRMGDMQKEGGPQGYMMWSGAKEGKKPTFGQNLKFLFRYQIGYMYLRYFMWNFVGRQNDLQGSTPDIFEGNWLSGINFIDNIRIGPQSNIPSTIAANKGRNKYYFLPLIIGLIGMFIQLKRNKLDFYTTLALFLWTGLMIIIYLNQPPFEPRERDYSHAGSFQTFCIWIGIGVIGIYSYLKEKLKVSATVIAIGSTVVCLMAAPVLMASQNWDDHDRSNRYLALSFAKNYLNSCEKNAILFTNGDNDTYPLWYIQNVEGYRSDVRIINLSLLGTDWYINALRRKIYDSEPLPISIPKENLVEGKRDYLRFFDGGQKFDQNAYFPLADVIKFMCFDNPENMVQDNSGAQTNYLPVKKFSIAVDKSACINAGVISDKDSGVVSSINFDMGKSTIMKGDLVVLDIIAQNAKTGWKRPIYFTTTTGSSAYLGLDEHFRLEGLTYRLVPIKSDKNEQGLIDRDLLYKRIMTQFEWGNMDKNLKMNIDEKATLVPNNMRVQMMQLARNYSLAGDNTKAVALLDYAQKVMPEATLPMELRLKYYFVDSYYQTGNIPKAEAMLKNFMTDCIAQIEYYKQFKMHRSNVSQKLQEYIQYMDQAVALVKAKGNKDLVSKYEPILNKFKSGL